MDGWLNASKRKMENNTKWNWLGVGHKNNISCFISVDCTLIYITMSAFCKKVKVYVVKFMRSTQFIVLCIKDWFEWYG